MEGPTVETMAYDRRSNIHYVVRAYRKLSEKELILTISMLRSQRKSKQLKSNSTVTITSLIGMSDAY